MASILGQTHRDLICLVVNDGDDPGPLRAALAGLDDDRLVVADLPHNRGRYFVDAATVRACQTRWWMPHDADDYSEPHRLASLLAAAEPETDAVFTPFVNHYQDGAIKVRPIRHLRPDGRRRYVTHSSQAWRREFVAPLTHPGTRVAWDGFVTSAAVLTGRVVMLPDPSYHRVRRPGSLVTSAETGRGSPFRRAQRAHQHRLWRQAVTAARRDGAVGVARVVARDIDPRLMREVREQAARLREALEVRAGDRVREQRDRVG